MKTSILLVFVYFLSTYCLGQTCLHQIDSVFSASDTTHFQNEIASLDDSCKTGWYHFYLAKAHFFQNDMVGVEENTEQIFSFLQTKPADGYILRAKAGLLCCLLLEEFRRTKQKQKFIFWKGKLDQLKLNRQCGTTHRERILKVVRLMINRFERNGDAKNLKYYQKRIGKNARFNRYIRNYMKY
jgi:hypothetical protein